MSFSFASFELCVEVDFLRKCDDANVMKFMEHILRFRNEHCNHEYFVEYFDVFKALSLEVNLVMYRPGPQSDVLYSLKR